MRGGVDAGSVGTASAYCFDMNTRKHISALKLSFRYLWNLAWDGVISLLCRWRFLPNKCIQILKYSSAWMETCVRAWPLSENNRLSICQRELCLPWASFIWPRTHLFFIFLQTNQCVCTWRGFVASCVGGSLCVHARAQRFAFKVTQLVYFSLCANSVLSCSSCLEETGAGIYS